MLPLFTKNHLLDKICKISDLTHYLTSSFSGYDKYVNDLFEELKVFSKFVTKNELQEFIDKKLQICLNKFDEKQFIQSSCELTVMSYFLRKKQDFNFIYEDKVSPPKDVDFSLNINNLNLNIEIKCSSYEGKCEKSNNTVVMNLQNRAPSRQIASDIITKLEQTLKNNDIGLVEQKNMDNNLKCFLTNAHSKFSNSKESDINILVVCCGDEIDMMTWRGYLFNEVSGFFTENSYIDSKLFNKVDYVLLTNLYHKHEKYNCSSVATNPWDLTNSFNLLYYNRFSLKPPPTKSFYAKFAKLFPVYTMEFEDYLTDQSNIPEGESSHIKENVLGILFFIEQSKYSGRNFFCKSELN